MQMSFLEAPSESEIQLAVLAKVPQRRRRYLSNVEQFSFLDILAMPEDVFIRVNWSDADIQVMYDRILRDALQTALDRRASPEMREDIWSWINDDSLRPFSFRACCALGTAITEWGVIDHDALRRNIAGMERRTHRMRDERARSQLGRQIA